MTISRFLHLLYCTPSLHGGSFGVLTRSRRGRWAGRDRCRSRRRRGRVRAWSEGRGPSRPSGGEDSGRRGWRTCRAPVAVGEWVHFDLLLLPILHSIGCMRVGFD
jgi:hypothetical protein